jgi:ribonuclease Z
MPRLAEMVKGVDLLYHESTYCNEQADRAKLYYHSTAEQAAMVAKAAGAGRLLLGHYSARYEDEQVMLNEARAVFPETYLTAENDVFEL